MEGKVFCIECGKYFKNLEEWKKIHDEKISHKLMDVHHNYLIEGNTLAYIQDLIQFKSEIYKKVIEQNNEIKKVKNILNYYEDSLQNDVCFETNINIKNIENKISGKCLIHFFPKSIQFNIESQGDIIFSGRKEFEIELLFPFRESKIKYCSIEKLNGCVFGQKVQNVFEQEVIIYNNYSSSINQRNKITSIKLLKNYNSVGLLEKKYIDINISGILTFSDFLFQQEKPCILYNINNKKFLYYKNFQWKFIENCFSDDDKGDVKNECIVNIKFDYEKKELFIFNQFNYLGNDYNFSTKDKNNANFKFEFFNKFYCILELKNNNNKYLSCDEDSDLIKLTNEKNYFIAYNI